MFQVKYQTTMTPDIHSTKNETNILSTPNVDLRIPRQHPEDSITNTMPAPGYDQSTPGAICFAHKWHTLFIYMVNLSVLLNTYLHFIYTFTNIKTRTSLNKIL